MPISIHALREEGDLIAGGSNFPVKKFLSTPSARRATPDSLSRLLPNLISIHALREEGDLPDSTVAVTLLISIHALREEGDIDQQAEIDSYLISIHALREEGDNSQPYP